MNRWVLITGSAQRIGRVIALEMAHAGWNIVVHYHTSRREALQTLKDIEALGRKACLAELDLTNLPLVEKLIPALAAEFGPLTALVNNASVFMPDSMDPDGTLHAAVNSEAPRLLSEAFRKQSRRTTAVIVNILDADPCAPDFSLYNASKKRLQNMTRDMAMRFAPALRVNGVALGPVLRNKRQSQQHFRKLVQKTPLKQSIAPQAVASAVRFLIEQPALTGAIIPVDGGLHLTHG